MRKIKEVLRLRFELGLGQQEIARACSISQETTLWVSKTGNSGRTESVTCDPGGF
jgi:predicted DNA-binding protein (UPF0251 family)